MLQWHLLPVPMYDYPNDFVCCTSELERFKDIGAIEVLQSLLLLYVKVVCLCVSAVS